MAARSRSDSRRTSRPQRLCIAGVLVLALAACATTDPSPEDLDLVQGQLEPARQLELAAAAVRAGRHGEAIDRYQAMLRADPDHLEARLGLGEAYLGRSANAEALTTFQTLLDRQDVVSAPEVRAAAQQGRGIALLRLGRVEEAHAVLSEAATSDPTLWRAWNALGQALDSRRAWDDARASYEQALWATPAPARVHNNLGVSLMRAGEHEAAITQFGKALQLDPDLRIAQANLRLALAFEGRYVEALAGVPQKDLPQILNNVGYIALLRGDHPRAEAYFLRALETSPSFYEPSWRNLQYLATLKDQGLAPIPTHGG